MGSASRRRGERGQATIEIIGIIPLAVLVTGAIIQLFMIGYAAVSAESSARLAARQASQGSAFSSAASAAERDAPRIFGPQVTVADGNLSTGGHEPSVSSEPVSDAVSAKATYTVPFLGIGVPGLDLNVTRYSVVPKTD